MFYYSGKLGKPNITRIDYYSCNRKATMLTALQFKRYLKKLQQLIFFSHFKKTSLPAYISQFVFSH